MKKLLYRAWAGFLTWFGDIKCFVFPLWLVYDPTYFSMTGEKIRRVQEKIRPGDVILHGYDMYLDGKFIPDRLKFSHGGIYAGGGKVIHAVAEGVSEQDLIEFCECDRIAVLRPSKGIRQALAAAKRFLKQKTPYDFGFERGASAVYCFELCGECYPGLDIPRKTVKKFFGLVKREDVYLAESFFESKDFDCVFQYNPKFKIDFEK